MRSGCGDNVAKITRYSLNLHDGVETATLDEDPAGDLVMNEDLLKVRDAFMNLLCFIHKDKGEYARLHGMKKASDDAMQIIFDERVKALPPLQREPTAI